MAEHLDRYHKLAAPRKSRFTQRFVEDITGLIGMITKDIVDRYLKVQSDKKFILDHFFLLE
jgi:hypothetical protein